MAKDKKCYFCDKEVTDDSYCYGCNHYVCEDCDETGVFGSHRVEEHQS